MMSDALEPMTTADGVAFLRTPEAAFAELSDFAYRPNYFSFEGLRIHYVDEGPRDGPVALLMHGMPTWSYLNRHIIRRLTEAGYRCIAADHAGFGRSDKVVSDDWYSISRHVQAHRALIDALDLQAITLFCQDWGGPISLAQVAERPARFERLVIMNTWLHHAAYEYTPRLIQWNGQWKPEGLFGANVPDRLSLGWFMALALGHMGPPDMFALIQTGTKPSLSPTGELARRGYDAPFVGLGHAGHAGPRRFPLSLPFDNPEGGAAEAQGHWHAALQTWTGPIHFIWGGADEVFTEAWGRTWASGFPQATFDLIPEAGHFLQDTHGEVIADHFLRRLRGAA